MKIPKIKYGIPLPPRYRAKAKISTSKWLRFFLKMKLGGSTGMLSRKEAMNINIAYFRHKRSGNLPKGYKLTMRKVGNKTGLWRTK